MYQPTRKMHLLEREWLEGCLGSLGLRYCRKSSSSPRGLNMGLASAGRFGCGVSGAAGASSHLDAQPCALSSLPVPPACPSATPFCFSAP